MIYREVKGARVPALGLGTFGLLGAACRRAVLTALEAGHRHIDTAEAYDNEAEVGRALAESGVPRADIFLTTKVWYTNLRPADVRRSVQASLERLRTDHVDLLLIHWPSRNVPLGATLAAFEELREARRARHIGVSNHTLALLEEAVRHSPNLICNQVEYHPYLSQKPVLDWLRRHGMLLTAYSPLAKGWVADDPVLVGIARAHGKTPAQVALRWLMQQDSVVAIPKSGSEARIRENFAVFDFELSEADMARIGSLARPDGRIIDPAWAPAWDPS